MSTVLWIVGEPGVGKTTLVRKLMAPISWNEKPKWTKCVQGVAAGHYTGDKFDGADTIPYNGVADALDFWFDNYVGMPLTVFDGDRFSFGDVVKFFSTRVPGHKRACALLTGPEAAAKRRKTRGGRGGPRGTEQNASWVKGRATKSNRFCEAFDGSTIHLNADSNENHSELLKTFLEKL